MIWPLCLCRHIPWRYAIAYSPRRASNHFRPRGKPLITGHQAWCAHHHYLEWAITHYLATELVYGRSHRQRNQWQQYDKPAPARSISCTTPYGRGLHRGKPPTSAHQTSEQDTPLGVCQNGRDESSSRVLSWRKRTRNVPPSPRRPRQVADIFTWIHCYTLYVSVLASRYQGVVPELMTYLVTITRVSQDFSGLAWVTYDAAFRHQAAITGNRKWSQINPSLYSICFTGCGLWYGDDLIGIVQTKDISLHH